MRQSPGAPDRAPGSSAGSTAGPGRGRPRPAATRRGGEGAGTAASRRGGEGVGTAASPRGGEGVGTAASRRGSCRAWCCCCRPPRSIACRWPCRSGLGLLLALSIARPPARPGRRRGAGPGLVLDHARGQPGTAAPGRGARAGRYRRSLSPPGVQPTGRRRRLFPAGRRRPGCRHGHRRGRRGGRGGARSRAGRPIPARGCSSATPPASLPRTTCTGPPRSCPVCRTRRC